MKLFDKSMINKITLMAGLVFAPFYAASAAVVFQTTGALSGQIISDIDGDLDGSVDDLNIASISLEGLLAGDYSFELTTDDFYSQIILIDDQGSLVDFQANPFQTNQTLSITGLAAGDYFLAVGEASFSLADALLGYDDNWSFANNFKPFGGNPEQGDWALTVNGPVTAVPLPAALPMFSAALLALGYLRRKVN